MLGGAILLEYDDEVLRVRVGAAPGLLVTLIVLS